MSSKEIEPEFYPIKLGGDRNFERDVNFPYNSAAASLRNGNLKTILNPRQMDLCAKAVVNDGILRALINKLIFNIKGERPKFVVKVNEELTEFETNERIKELEKEILEGKKYGEKVKQFKTNMVRINRRVEFFSRLDSLLFNTFTFGRNGLRIHRFSTSESNGMFPIYGEPKALTVLQSRRISDVRVDPTTGEFRGFMYDYGGQKSKTLIPAIDLIPAFNNDINLFDNTNFSGLSLVWTVLSISQTNSVINDKDIPESVLRAWAKQGFIYAGTSKKGVLKKLRENIEASTHLVHNQKELLAQVLDIARDLMELPNVRTANAKYMSWCLMMPLFLMFEDDANFATAAQAVQAFKVGVVDYYRTWIQGFLEKYWYDPILADSLGVPVEEIIEQPVRVKATWQDLIYDPFADKVEAFTKLKQADVYDNEKILTELNADDVLERQKEQANSQEIEKLRGIIAQMAKQMAVQTQRDLDAGNLKKDNNPMIENQQENPQKI
jgi:hypothetical protein